MSDAPDNDETLDTISGEEEGCLERVLDHLKVAAESREEKKGKDYSEELISLRDQISVARNEDIPPLLEQMERVQALAARQQKVKEDYIDPRSPYFGRMVLQEGERRREVLVGRGTHVDTKTSVRIVDWRDAPVSRLYYRYAEGDDYSEVFGDREIDGEVLVRRSVTISEGAVRRISAPQGNFAKSRKHGWIRLDDANLKLAGGQGSALRPEGKARGKLGVGDTLTDYEDKHLKEITPLIDGRQFDLITQPDSGLVVIQGGAGSGKTTIGLHRLAYLNFHDRRRFRPDKMLVVVFNQALVRYIGQVLPSLGLTGVQIRTYQDWAARLRATALPDLPRVYSDETPSAVTRMKKHPRMLELITGYVQGQAQAIAAELRPLVDVDPNLEPGLQTFERATERPLMHRLHGFKRWIQDHEEALLPEARHPALRHIERSIAKYFDVTHLWAELLTTRSLIVDELGKLTGDEFRPGELDRAHTWCVKQCNRALHEAEEKLEEQGEDKASDHEFRAVDGLDLEDRAALDREDDSLLLKFLQLVRGPLRRGQNSKEALSYEHVLVDEAQDLSPVEMSVVFGTVSRGQSVTLAGDTAQRLHMDNGFSDWKTVLGDLGLSHVEVEPLKLSYRSTAEILDLAQHVLGDLKPEDPPEATRHGAPVELFQFGDTGDAVAFLSESLRDLSIAEPRASIAVVARYPEQADLFYNGLQRGDVPYLRRVDDQNFPFKPGVDVTDIRQVKGLEFDYVVLVELSESAYPDEDESRHLLHIGVTRAAHQLWLLSSGRPSKLLPETLRERGY